MTVKRNVDGLRQSAQKKRQDALDKVERGIRRLLKEGKTVNFNTVSIAADVSKAFLYKETEIKERIEHLRKQGLGKKLEPRQRASDDSKNAVIKTLRDRIKVLEAEVRDLRKQNEVFGAQVLRARTLDQRLSGLQKENDKLRQGLTSTQSEVEETNNSDLTAELVKLGVQLNTTIRRAIQEAPKDILLKALESLREASIERRVENPSGFFYRAVTDAWKPSEAHEKKSLQSAFNEWYALAQEAGIVQAATEIEGVQCVLLVDGNWISFDEVKNLYPVENLKDQ